MISKSKNISSARQRSGLPSPASRPHLADLHRAPSQSSKANEAESPEGVDLLEAGEQRLNSEAVGVFVITWHVTTTEVSGDAEGGCQTLKPKPLMRKV